MMPVRIAMQTVDAMNWGAEVLRASQHTPVVVNFGAPWCGLCQLFKPLLHQFETQQVDQVRLVNINTDENLKLASTYKITSLPTLLLIVEGEVVQRFEKFRDREDLRQSLEQIATAASLVSA
jgi:thioredoxin 1